MISGEKNLKNFNELEELEFSYIDPRNKNLYGCFLDEAFSKFTNKEKEHLKLYKMRIFTCI